MTDQFNSIVVMYYPARQSLDFLADVVHYYSLMMAANFGNYMLVKILILYAGKIQVDASSFLMGLIMAQCYDITLWFQGNGTWSAS